MRSMPRLKAKSLRNSILAFVWAVGAAPSHAGDALDTMVAAYPGALAGRTGNALIFRNGYRMDAGILHQDVPLGGLLAHASIRDTFLYAYPRDSRAQPPPDFDPGRLRNKALLDAMYGDCRRGEVETNLVSVVWLPHVWGKPVRITHINGVSEKLRAVSDEIEKLPPEIRRAAWPIEGDYDCRKVADGGQPSMHAYGAAVDLNLHYSDYWYWDTSHGASAVHYRNRMPSEIVAAFERHGFIWGGRWYHYDTMHFEYRPELLAGRLPELNEVQPLPDHAAAAR